MAQVLERASEGERAVIAKSNYAGDIGKIDPQMEFIVSAKCEHNQGQWVCLTHKMSFSNQFVKDTHIHAGKHKLGWFCAFCGTVQVP